ncbi:MAG TPA: indolepyruvate oxidoreductase subunit beta [Clostridia bacterium]|nr:indolepyruvate oxidoreductase subunit beta [Clostridia bacterium]
MAKVTNILLVGVGGQGTVLASKILGQVAVSLGQEVKVAEIHGMSQRGGSVVTQVRFGEKVYAPTIPKGQADVILAFEKMEALRWLPYLRKGGHIIVNDQEIDPMPVIVGSVAYPEKIIEQLEAAAQVTVVPALRLAEEAGNGKAVNVVLLGVLAQRLGIDAATWRRVLAEVVPPKTLAVNQKAFELGLAFSTAEAS